MVYGIKRNVKLSFDEAVKKVKAELAKEGFGILTEVDVRKTLKQKLNIEHPNYIILGACNPQLGHEALHKEKLIGLFMPCNVIVFEDGKNTVVATQETTKLAELLDNDELQSVASTVEKHLRNAIERV